MTPGKPVGLLVAFLFCAVLIVPPPAVAAAASPLRMIDAAAIVRQVAAGLPLFERRVVIGGDLRLPANVTGPLSIRDSFFRGTVIATSASFHGLVDFSGSHFEGGFDFSEARFQGPLLFASVTTAAARQGRFRFAEFDGPAVFASAQFQGPVSFADSSFHGESRYQNAHFSAASFRFASFDHAANFRRARFNDSASFGGDEFRATADFSYSRFLGSAGFDGARFAGSAAFTSADFLSPAAQTSATFSAAHFDGGADFFLAVFANGAKFDSAQASQELDFESTTFSGSSTTFEHARFFAPADFSDHAFFHGKLSFDEAELAQLNLDDANLTTSHVYLPGKHKGGHLDSLRMDPADVSYVSVVGRSDAVRKQREDTLALIESAARAGGDLHAAAEAGVRRLTLGRKDDSALVHALDWLFYWQVCGYFLRPWHPFWALVITTVLFALLKLWIYDRHKRRAERLGNFIKHLWHSATALTPRNRPAATRSERIIGWVEPNLHRVLVAILLLAVGNVWPPVAGLLKGVLT